MSLWVFAYQVTEEYVFESLSREYPCHVKWNLHSIILKNPIARLSIKL